MSLRQLLSTQDRKIILVLIVSIIAIGIYSVSSQNSSLAQIRNLTDQVEMNVDSLKLINSRYDSLETEYTKVYEAFAKTRNQLDTFKLKLSTIMSSNIRSVNSINNQLQNLLDGQLEFEKVEVDEDDFRF